MFSIRIVTLRGLRSICGGLATIEDAIDEAESLIRRGSRTRGSLRIYRKESWYATR